MSRVSDIQALATFAHSRGALVIVDNTFLTPLLQRPLELGADIVVHSGTKFLAGHNDTLAGFAVCADEGLAERLFAIQKTTGAVLGPSIPGSCCAASRPSPSGSADRRRARESSRRGSGPGRGERGPLRRIGDHRNARSRSARPRASAP